MNHLTMAIVLSAALAVPTWAQDSEEAPDEGVARISLLSGEVLIRRGDTGETIAAERNAPLVGLDHLITQRDARAEIQFDWANMMRLAPDSEVRIGELRDGDFFLQVIEGTVTFRMLRDSTATTEISTPTLSVKPLEKGSYRVTVKPDGSTDVTVRSGEAEIFTPQGSQRLRSGRTLETRSDPADPEPRLVSAIRNDEWDRWNDSRDRDLERSQSHRYVSRDIYGIEDLDSHGRWVYDDPYGWVWAPHVTSAWAPYRVGRWEWVNYYGWTWVSSDPWGWAPYHYGRWYHTPRVGWVWYPGTVGPRYYWQPALVGFFGWGSASTVSVGFSFGNVGWVPLAPYEVYRPWYGRRNVIVNNITVVNNVNIINTYRNARDYDRHHGLTSINARDFGRGRITTTNYIRVADRDLRRAGDVRGSIPIERRRDDRQGSGRSVARRGNEDRPFVTRPDRGRNTRVTSPVTRTTDTRPDDRPRTGTGDRRVEGTPRTDDRPRTGTGDRRVEGTPRTDDRPRTGTGDRRVEGTPRTDDRPRVDNRPGTDDRPRTGDRRVEGTPRTDDRPRTGTGDRRVEGTPRTDDRPRVGDRPRTPQTTQNRPTSPVDARPDRRAGANSGGNSGSRPSRPDQPRVNVPTTPTDTGRIDRGRRTEPETQRGGGRPDDGGRRNPGVSTPTPQPQTPAQPGRVERNSSPQGQGQGQQGQGRGRGGDDENRRRGR